MQIIATAAHNRNDERAVAAAAKSPLDEKSRRSTSSTVPRICAAEIGVIGGGEALPSMPRCRVVDTVVAILAIASCIAAEGFRESRIGGKPPNRLGVLDEVEQEGRPPAGRQLRGDSVTSPTSSISHAIGHHMKSARAEHLRSASRRRSVWDGDCARAAPIDSSSAANRQ